MARPSFGEAVWRTSGENATSTAGRSLEDGPTIHRMPSVSVKRRRKVQERSVRTSPRRAGCFGTRSARFLRKVQLAVLETGTWRGVHKTDTAVEGRALKGSKAQESIGLGIAATR
jgi:hypothetical protein